MARYSDVRAITVLVALIATTSALAQSAAKPKAGSTTKQLPKLAVTVAMQDAGGQDRENVEDLLMIELGNQPFWQLVDRQALQAVMKEHAIALSSQADTKDAIALGKFVGADYLLHVLLEKETATIRLVEVASGQVKLEGEVALREDLTLSAAAIRERALTALRPESQAANRLTVGIAAFPNRSGTDRSDKLGIELQKALRKRLQEGPWAIVLERQYPTALLEEVDLARLGLVRKNGVETLPPADLVILGTLEDVGREYEPGKPWEVKLELTLRLRGYSSQIGRLCRSDAVEAISDQIVRSIDESRRGQPVRQAAVSEKELWRRQAQYLMPESGRPYIGSPYGSLDQRARMDTIEILRACENILLLDPEDATAMMYRGLCLIAINEQPLLDWPTATPAQQRAAATQCVAGSRMVERALSIHPAPSQARGFWWCVQTLDNIGWGVQTPDNIGLPGRAKEMAQYIVDHRQLFNSLEAYQWAIVDKVKNGSALAADASLKAFYDELSRTIRKVDENPDGVLLAFERFASHDKGPTEQNISFLASYLDHPDPVVQFVVHRRMAALVCFGKGDRAGLRHFDRAIAMMDAALARLKVYYASTELHDIYRLKVNACELLGLPEEAKKTALAGGRHFMAAGPCDITSAWLYHYCVANVLGRGQEEEALKICDAFLAGTNGPHRFVSDKASQVAAKREELLARLNGKPVPGLGNLRLAHGTEPLSVHRESERWMIMLRMAADDGSIWLASPQGPSSMWGRPLRYRPDVDKTERIELSSTDGVDCVAATKNAIYFGGLREGIYKLDATGRLLKRYCRKDGSLPFDWIVDICAVGDKLYFCYRNGARSGVASLDTATDNVTILAPSTREATSNSEPVEDISRVWWDAVTPRLYASSHDRDMWFYPRLQFQYALTPGGKSWERLQGDSAPRFVLSQGNETLIVRLRGKAVDFSFPRSGKSVSTELPLPSFMGDPAWDENRIWVPTSAGLYEVDRNTGRVGWLAYQNDTMFLSALRHGDRLYIATSRGLYYREIP